MEGHRRYADEPEPSSWYSGQDQYPSSSSYDPGAQERPSGAFRLPEQRDDEYVTPLPYVTPDPVTSTGGHSRTADQPAEPVRIPVRGPEYPTVRPAGATSLADAQPATYGSAASAATTYGGGASAPVSAPSTAPVSAGIPPGSPFAGGPVPAGAAGGSPVPGGLVLDGPVPGSPVPGGPASGRPAFGRPASGRPASGRPAAAGPAGEPGGAYNDRTGVVPPVSRFGPESKPVERVYRTRYPVPAVVVAVATVLLMVPVVMLLIQATFVDDPVARGIVPAVLLTLGLPLAGAGLFAVSGGGPVSRETLLRPPVVYLPIGLVLLLAAGLAVA